MDGPILVTLPSSSYGTQKDSTSLQSRCRKMSLCIVVGATTCIWLSLTAASSKFTNFASNIQAQPLTRIVPGAPTYFLQEKLPKAMHSLDVDNVHLQNGLHPIAATSQPFKRVVDSAAISVAKWAIFLGTFAAMAFAFWTKSKPQKSEQNGEFLPLPNLDYNPLYEMVRQLVRGEDLNFTPQWTAAATAGEAAPSEDDIVNLVIVGSGPAGFTAAIYAARANLRPIVFEGYRSGGVPGGQLMGTTEVENFPGFPEGITGPQLMDRMRKQAIRWGATLHTEDVEFMDLSQRPFIIRSSDREIKAQSVILATGATAKRLGLPSEEKFWSNGISACAICDGASPMFKDKELAVVGGGDTALEEAVYLTKYGSRIHLLVRGEGFRASKAMVERVARYPQITVHLNTAVEDAYADPSGKHMGGLVLKDRATGETRKLPVAGMFYGIGHSPNNEVFKDQVKLDDSGYVLVEPGTCKTNIEGVFAAGDLQDHEWRQAITAAGSGCMAALSAERFLVATGSLIVHEAQVQQPSEVEGKDEDKPLVQETESTFDINQTKHTGEFALRKLYHESDRLLGVLYTAPSCGPCRVLKPVFDKVVDEYGSRMHYVLIDIEQSPQIAEAAGVTGTPTIQFFKKKAKVGELGGVKMKRDYRQFIDQHI